MPRHILVPFDDSSPSTLALEYALREYPDEKLTVVHVLNPRQYHLYDKGTRTRRNSSHRWNREAKSYSSAPVKPAANTMSTLKRR